MSERVLIVGSSGGHLTQLLALRRWWSQYERAWVTFDTLDAKEALREETDVSWAYRPTTRNVPNLLRNTVLAYRTLRRFKPTIVISTGAAVAWPFFLFARVRNARTVYIEVYDRIETPTLTGRLCRPVSDLMLVQWEEQRRMYDDAIVVGRLM